jgi:TolB-like protein/DNA-binding winged helix-turn-helix (wHTH) protein
VRFGTFEVDLRAGELRKSGMKLKLSGQPFQVLTILLEHPGEVVTREELQQRLWPDTFVDAERGLNTAINKIREVLGDSAENPRFVETLPRRGYRFVGELAKQSSTEAELDDGKGARRPGTKIAVAAALILLLATILIVRWIQTSRSAKRAVSIGSLAVLPLDNLSGDSSQDYFADGMTEELITMLAKATSLRVVQYKGVHRPLRDIAQELGVDGIVEGSVARSRSGVHMTVQLIHAPSDTHLWAESYDRDLAGANSLPMELAQAIAKQVGKGSSAPVGRQRYISPEAHDAYLLGRYYWYASDSPTKSGEYFHRAIDLQPDYAAAWSGVSHYYILRGMVGLAPPAEIMPQAEAAARKAVELDDSLAEAHHSMAAVYAFYRWDWEAAERESERALQLDPNFAQVHHLRSYLFAALNRTEEGVQEEKASMELDPFLHPWALGTALLRARQFDAALSEGRLLAEVPLGDPDVHQLLSDAYRFKGMEKESVQELEKQFLLQNNEESATAVRRAFDQGGYKAVLEWQLSELKKKAAKGYVSPWWFALAYAQLGRKEETLHSLEDAYKEHSPRLIFLQSEPDLDFLHSDLRYRALVTQVGLPPAF